MKKEKIKTILVVEDEPSISQVCTKVLTKNGYKVDVATNAKIASQTGGMSIHLGNAVQPSIWFVQPGLSLGQCKD